MFCPKSDGLQQSCQHFEIQVLNSKSKNTYQITFCSHWCPRDSISRSFFNIDQMLTSHTIPTPAFSFLFGLPSGLAKEELKNNDDIAFVCLKLFSIRNTADDNLLKFYVLLTVYHYVSL
jgi:hypothetical protein